MECDGKDDSHILVQHVIYMYTCITLYADWKLFCNSAIVTFVPPTKHTHTQTHTYTHIHHLQHTPSACPNDPFHSPPSLHLVSNCLFGCFILDWKISAKRHGHHPFPVSSSLGTAAPDLSVLFKHPTHIPGPGEGRGYKPWPFALPLLRPHTARKPHYTRPHGPHCLTIGNSFLNCQK